MGSFARPDWKPEEIEKLKVLCEEGKTPYREMAKILNRTVYGIEFKRGQLKIRNKYHASIYSHDEKFFSEPTPQNCYWAALIATDGHIGWNKTAPYIRWALAIKDKSMLERFVEDLRATNPIKHGFSTCSIAKDKTTRHEHCSVFINNSRQIVSDLQKHFGITKNKTLRSALPNLPTLYHKLCYIRGFIDGDGMISRAKNQKGLINITVCGCNREMISWIKETVDSMNLPRLNGKKPSLLTQPPDEGCYYFSVRGFKAAVLFEILRRLPVHNLSRKWDNPVILEEVEHWKCQKDIWPPETYFENLLRDAQITTSKITENSSTNSVLLSR